MDKHKLIFPISILVGCVILGGFFYASQVSKQKSIEKQQESKMMEERRAMEVKAELDKKEYMAKQKDACLNIYQVESKKWNNAESWNYNNDTDKCEITYKDPNKKPKAECEKNLEKAKDVFKDVTVPSYYYEAYYHCLDGTFEKEF